MLSINTNLSSYIAQRSLSRSTSILNAAIERMSTGYKINHASDNAANYSIATNMSSQISAYQVAEDNVAMGLDLISTASSSLELISSHLSRIRDLCEQASNGTYGAESIKAIRQEAQARVYEIYRIYANTEYNGIKLFDNTESPDLEEELGEEAEEAEEEIVEEEIVEEIVEEDPVEEDLVEEAEEEELAEETNSLIIKLQVGTASDENSKITVSTTFDLSGLNSLVAEINKPSTLTKIDKLINKVSSKQTELGAAQNRLESALESISVNYNNLVSSRSTLRDADIAKESSRYIQ